MIRRSRRAHSEDDDMDEGIPTDRRRVRPRLSLEEFSNFDLDHHTESEADLAQTVFVDITAEVAATSSDENVFVCPAPENVIILEKVSGMNASNGSSSTVSVYPIAVFPAPSQSDRSRPSGLLSVAHTEATTTDSSEHDTLMATSTGFSSEEDLAAHLSSMRLHNSIASVSLARHFINNSPSPSAGVDQSVREDSVPSTSTFFQPQQPESPASGSSMEEE